MDSERILLEWRPEKDVQSQKKGDKTSTPERCDYPKYGVNKEIN